MQKSVLCIFQKYLNILTLVRVGNSKKLGLKCTYEMQRYVNILDLHACMHWCSPRTAPGFCCLNHPRPQNRSDHHKVL